MVIKNWITKKSIVPAFTIVLIVGSLSAFSKVKEKSSLTLIPIYGLFETSITGVQVSQNQFTTFAKFTFVNRNRIVTVDGFYDGDSTWRVRFMPDAFGKWNYTWKIGSFNGSGNFLCKGTSDTLVHGHIRVDKNNPMALICDDSTPFYAYGGKWFSARNYYIDTIGSPEKGASGAPMSDSLLITYLDIMQKYRHNSSLVKICFYPLNDDGYTWNVEYVKRGEWFVQEMAKRGIYCQINFFDTWSRQKGAIKPVTKGVSQVLNPWSDQNDDQIKNYIRTIVARFASFYNVYWELGNEILSTIRKPGDPNVFVAQSNKKYIPWIHEYDPYDLPIGCSYVNNDSFMQVLNVDINFPHDDEMALRYVKFNKPMILNEPCNTGGADALDSSIRNQLLGHNYRHTFWTMFTLGGAGAYESSWLDINSPFNDAVINVMSYQKNLRSFIERLPVSINAMDKCTRNLLSDIDTSVQFTRAKEGICSVTYLKSGASLKKSSVAMPFGKYYMQWYDPTNDTYTESVELNIDDSKTGIFIPSISNDLVLLINKK